jgi:hypothetical protein
MPTPEEIVTELLKQLHFLVDRDLDNSSMDDFSEIFAQYPVGMSEEDRVVLVGKLQATLDRDADKQCCPL